MLATRTLPVSSFGFNNFCIHSPLPSQVTQKRGSPNVNQKYFFRIQIPIPKLLPFRCSQHNVDWSSPYLFSGGSFEPSTISSLLKSCCSLKGVKAVHSISIRLFGTSTIFLSNNLIDAYARFFDLENARKLFDAMPERSAVSWTTILNGYINADLEDDALKIYQKQVSFNIVANSLTLVCLLKLCAKRMNFELGRRIHARVIRGNWRNLIVDSALLHFYASCADLYHASTVFNQMLVRDVISWTTMISAYTQHGQERHALSLFSQMQCHGFRPNEFTICSALKACGELKALSFGRQLHGCITKGIFNKDVFIESSLVGMYVRCNKVLDARSVFNLMPERNTVTWTTMISGYTQNGLGAEAINLFKRMKELRVYANNLTIVSLIGACTSFSSLRLGKEVHGQIVKNISNSNTHIGSTLISMYCKCGQDDYAARVLEMMPIRDCVSWTAMISGCASLGHGLKALKFLINMLREGLEPNPFTFSSALKACTKLEAVNYGKWIHSFVNKTMTVQNMFVGSALIGMYMRCGCVADAFSVFDRLPQRNWISWKMMVLGYAKNRQCEKAMKFMYQMKAEGFHVDDFILTRVLSSCGDSVDQGDSSSTSFNLSL